MATDGADQATLSDSYGHTSPCLPVEGAADQPIEGRDEEAAAPALTLAPASAAVATAKRHCFAMTMTVPLRDLSHTFYLK